MNFNSNLSILTISSKITQKIKVQIQSLSCSMTQKAILAFSGGLDTSVVVKYLQEKHGMDVITVTVDVGQGDNPNTIAAKAKKEKVTALAHGCSGKGNDQVRFDITMRAGSNLPIIAPIRDMNLDRTTELAFAKKHGIKIDTVAKKFSIDQNLWGRAIEGGVLEDAFKEPPDDAFIWVKTKKCIIRR